MHKVFILSFTSIVIGLITIVVSQSALAGTTVRDHRGDTAVAHPVKSLKLLPGQCKRGDLNCGHHKGTIYGGATVRDHRH
jgi:hypothetical protein